jgi:hypothetical protein
VYKNLCKIIWQLYTPIPEITICTEMLDFGRYAFSKASITINKLRNVHYYHQFKIEFALENDKVPTMWRKKISTHADWASKDEVKFLKKEI